MTDMGFLNRLPACFILIEELKDWGYLLMKEKRKRRKHEDFVKEIYELVGDEYEVVSQFKNIKINVEFLHKTCNKIFTKIPDKFIKLGQRCPYCTGKKRKTKNVKKINEEFVKEIKSLVGNEYTFLEEYKGALFSILVRHNSEKCNFHEYKTKPSDFLNEKRCAKCAGKYSTTKNEYKQMIFDKRGDEYILYDGYIKMSSDVFIKHNIDECGYIFKTNASRFIYSDIKCPLCRNFKGQNKIKKYLEDNNIKYSINFSFSDLKGINGGHLTFDFVIYNIYNNINFLIEYQCHQHYESIEIFGGVERFNNQVKNDNKKRIYCKDNNINLLEIPYWEYKNIENIIENYMRKE